ncbi:MAG: hypothetical protein ACR2RB_01770, partial [Gammaproteobacteria bacterium]
MDADPANGLKRPELVGFASPHLSPRGEMIAQRFDFTRHFLTERNTGRISEKKKMRCGIKDQARARH